MSILNDKQIRDLALSSTMIQPFHGSLVRELVDHSYDDPVYRKIISFGLSSFGYDIRLSNKQFEVFRHIPGQIVDPKNFGLGHLQEVEMQRDDDGSEYFILPGHTYGLGVAMERLQIPDDVTVLCIGKSTYARCGVIANLTPAEAGWEGHLTLEFSNSSDTDCRIYANEGVVQLLFFQGEPCHTSYRDRRGKYQDQPQSVVPARV